jgi:hypothetical protein
MRPNFNRKGLGVGLCTCHANDGMKHKIGGFWSMPDLAKKQDPICKITRAKSVEQAIEHLPGKHETISSDPSTTKIIIIVIINPKKQTKQHNQKSM